jgi:hypothetical protein
VQFRNWNWLALQETFPGVLKFLNIIEREKRCDTIPTGAIVSFSLFTPQIR